MAKKAKKKSITQVCFLLDETQSMQVRKSETIQGFNKYLESLKKDEGDEVLFTLTTFNKSGIKTPYSATPVEKVKSLNDENYQPQNWTPLYDAIGATIHSAKKSVKENELVLFVILTDGEENSSTEYTQEEIKALIKKQEKAGWKFTFLGVGIDAFAAGHKFGLQKSSTFDVGISAQATNTLYSSLAAGTTSLRSTYSNQGIGATMSCSVLSDSDRKKLKD